MRFGAGFFPLQVNIFIIFLVFFGSRLSGQNIPILERFEDYDLVSYALELQISAEQSRIAGTQHIRIRPLRSTRSIWLDMGPELKVAEIIWQNQKLAFDYLGEALRIDFPEILHSDKYEEFSLVYHGNLRGTSPYPVWQKNEFDRLQVGLDPSHLPAYFWWPCKEHGEDPADSMKLSVILPQELSLFCSGEKVSSQWMPGNFVKHSFVLEGPVFPDQLSLYIGNFETIQDSMESNGRKFSMTFHVQPENKSQAFSHLAQVKRIFSTLGNYFGEYPRISTGYSWFQPLDIRSAKYLFQNNEWGFDPILARDIARQYSTYIPHNSDSLGRIIFEAFPYYVEYLLVEKWYDKASARKFLNQGKAPVYRTLALLEAVRKEAPSDDLWFDQMANFLQQDKKGRFSSEFFQAELGSESAKMMDQLFSLQQKPIFQYHLSGKKRKLKCYFRWKNAPEGFDYPIYLYVGEERQKLIPNQSWQELTFRGVPPRNVKPEEGQSWYEIREESFLRD